MVEVEIEDLTKRFGEVIAVKNLNLHVKDKEFIVLLGPSGCGKTTTLRCIAGLEKIDEGRISIGKKIINDVPPEDRDVAMVFQSYALYPHMRVYDNIAFPLKARKVSKQEIDKRVREVAQLMQISHLLDRKPGELSGGQKQRVALGRAIVRTPSVFLMDEPLSNLDAKLRVYMRTELKAFQRDLGITTIYVTHDQIEAMTMADKVALLSEGILQQYATPSEIYNRPANQFVASFIGTPPMNFIECSLVEKNTSLYLDASWFELRLDKDVAEIIKKETTGSELILGARVEDLLVHSRRVDGSFDCKVYVTECLGNETIINVKKDEKILKVKVPGTINANVGDSIWLSFDKNKLYLFDKKTGKAVLY